MWTPVSPQLSQPLQQAFPYVMPVVLLIAALLMVSRFAYAHLINRFLRGRKRFRSVVWLFLLVMLLKWQPQITTLVLIYLYAMSAPAAALWKAVTPWRGRGPTPGAA